MQPSAAAARFRLNWTSRKYNDRVAYDLRNEAVGGSDDCFDIFAGGHAEISDLVSAKDGVGRQRVAELFNICGGADSLAISRNADAFLGDGVVFVPAQSNDPSCTDRICNIEHLCASLVAAKEITGSNAEALAAIAKVQRNGGDNIDNDTCVEVDWEQMIAYLSSDEDMDIPQIPSRKRKADEDDDLFDSNDNVAYAAHAMEHVLNLPPEHHWREHLRDEDLSRLCAFYAEDRLEAPAVVERKKKRKKNINLKRRRRTLASYFATTRLQTLSERD